MTDRDGKPVARHSIRRAMQDLADGKKIITGYEIYADEPKVTNRASSGSDVPPTPRLEDVISALKSKLANGPESTDVSIAKRSAKVNNVETDDGDPPHGPGRRKADSGGDSSKVQTVWRLAGVRRLVLIGVVNELERIVGSW